MMLAHLILQQGSKSSSMRPSMAFLASLHLQDSKHLKSHCACISRFERFGGWSCRKVSVGGLRMQGVLPYKSKMLAGVLLNSPTHCPCLECTTVNASTDLFPRHGRSALGKWIKNIVIEKISSLVRNSRDLRRTMLIS
eukprot:TRINITY_DN6075_c1_g2_i2.p1 TRINITY_DN6075_c1_g2~~TRINITY_DN6075_c1_g2_i2.p1  ORF type:complete len:138 (+),score=13.45 TRINITY_DN6075_c1_g2_i2:355-768(+)